MNSTGWPPNTPYDCAEARRTQVADATFRDWAKTAQAKKFPYKQTQSALLSPSQALPLDSAAHAVHVYSLPEHCLARIPSH